MRGPRLCQCGHSVEQHEMTGMCRERCKGCECTDFSPKDTVVTGTAITARRLSEAEALDAYLHNRQVGLTLEMVRRFDQMFVFGKPEDFDVV